MSNRDLEFDFEDILEDFNSYSDSLVDGEEKKSPADGGNSAPVSNWKPRPEKSSVKPAADIPDSGFSAEDILADFDLGAFSTEPGPEADPFAGFGEDLSPAEVPDRPSAPVPKKKADSGAVHPEKQRGASASAAGDRKSSGGPEYYVDMSRLTKYLQNRKNSGKNGKAAEEKFSPEFKPEGHEYKSPVITLMAPKKNSGGHNKAVAEFDPDKFMTYSERKEADKLQKKVEKKHAAERKQEKALKQRESEDKLERRLADIDKAHSRSPVRGLIAAVFVVLSIFSFGWIIKNIHPDSGTVNAAVSRGHLDLTDKLDVYMNNAASDALGEIAYIKKIYTISEGDAAPRPNPAAFGSTTDPAVIQGVIDKSRGLLDGQETVWKPDLPFYPGTEMHYYSDPTILVIVWKQVLEERCCTCAEVKIAHGSQFRRRIAEDTYGSSVQFYASQLADASNAVVASNADFYAFRNIGLTVYQRQLFRNSPDVLDTCFINSAGDMLFARSGELGDDDSVRQYVEDNDVVFSLSFGPVLVENGEVQNCESYPIGEVNTQYSRAGIGMTDKLHYLLMTVNHTDDRPRATVGVFAQLMQQMGCVKAYNLDGGQTSEIVMEGKPVNYIDFNAERTVSDIIYFATALPESEVTQ